VTSTRVTSTVRNNGHHRRPDRVTSVTVNPRRTGRRYSNRHNRTYGSYHNTYNYYTPYRHNYVARRNYLRTVNYYNHVYRYNPGHIFRNWIRVPAHRNRGYHVVDGYPYYVYNGYRYRYSNYDYCNYQLVDTRSYNVIERYSDYICSRGLDECMEDANFENSYEYGRPYQCLEAHRSY
jgi:hypothetical protein